jgi:hypothetical protein
MSESLINRINRLRRNLCGTWNFRICTSETSPVSQLRWSVWLILFVFIG